MDVRVRRTLHTSPTRWRMRHDGSIGMAVHDDWLNLPLGCEF